MTHVHRSSTKGVRDGLNKCAVVIPAKAGVHCEALLPALRLGGFGCRRPGFGDGPSHFAAAYARYRNTNTSNDTTTKTISICRRRCACFVSGNLGWPFA